MARPLRPRVENGIHHVYNRGNALRPIFEREGQRAEFLRLLTRVRDRCGWTCLCYCLMGNHYHLVIRTPLANISEGMRELGSSYAQAFNRGREKPGPVFQGRFKCKLIQHDAYYLATLRYLALNPVAAGLCDEPKGWPWSAHNAIIGCREPGIVAVQETLGLLDENADRALSVYRRSIDDRTDVAVPKARGGIVVGDREFTASALLGAVQSPEMPLRERLADRPDLAEIFLGDREEALLAAYVTFGYSQREIAEHLECHYSTVSRWIRAARMRQRKT